ncbi:Dienelactone hydrolase domain-containing protein [Sphingomonas antarctica]|uniref:dienelactone hydrolase family protein n=1 Tax=Sphingomonas antarctica TaxID=2040274 RepID=UPI0039ECA40E
MAGNYQDYHHGDVTCEAYVAGAVAGQRRPAVLVGHTWGGQSDHERETADRLAALGYVGIAIDVYGKGRRGEHGTPTAMAVNTALMTPFIQDRAMLRDRMLAAVAFAKTIPGVDATRIAVMGYCFGGLCALDVARSGADDVRGAVSIHGIFAPPGFGEQAQITTKVLILHGWEDPMAKPDDVVMVAKELTEAGADWQLNAYGHAMHAYTAPGANMPERGLQYSESATRRSWQAIENFLAEVLV